MKSLKYAPPWTLESGMKPRQDFRVMSPILGSLRGFFSGTFLLSSFIISSSHDRGIPPSGWACHCSTLIRACVMPNLLGMLSSYWIAQDSLQDWLIKLFSRHGRELFFGVISEACTMVVVQYSLRYSTTSTFSTGLREVMPFCPGRTPLFANYRVLLLMSVQKQEGFSTFFSATVLMIMGRNECVQTTKCVHLWLPSKHLSFNCSTV